MRPVNGGSGANRGNQSPRLPLSLSRPSSGYKARRVTNHEELPWDIYEVICKKLKHDDLFQFSGVCQSWRLFHKTYWKSYMESQSPFIIQKSSFAKKSLTFLSLPQREMDKLEMGNFWGLCYARCSSGYLIFIGPSNVLMMNPFTRREKNVSTVPLRVNYDYKDYRALLSFVKDSEEFVIVVQSSVSAHNLHVYQSRNSGWATCSNAFVPWKVVDFVVFNNAIYVLTNEANIGVLNLNSVSIEFLELQNTPAKDCDNLKLASCDGKLLMVHFKPGVELDVYEIKFSNMEYVKLDTLGDLTLFYSSLACHALSNPSRWGYTSNHVYSISDSSPRCEVYSWSNELRRIYSPNPRVLQAPNRSKLYWLDWYFRHLRDEVDYSLAE